MGELKGAPKVKSLRCLSRIINGYLAVNIAPPLAVVTISNIAYGGFQYIAGGMLRIYGGGGGGLGLYGNVSMDII